MFRTDRSAKVHGDDTVDLKPFINYLVVLIPVLMISAEFSKTAVQTATLSDNGSRTDSVSLEKQPPMRLVVTVSDSSVVIATADRFLKCLSVGASGFPAEDLDKSLNAIRAQIPAEVTAITIASDDAVRYQRIIDVMDLAKKNGFGDVSITRLRT